MKNMTPEQMRLAIKMAIGFADINKTAKKCLTDAFIALTHAEVVSLYDKLQTAMKHFEDQNESAPPPTAAKRKTRSRAAA